MSPQKNRLQFLDALRGVAVFLVIFCHITHENYPAVQFIDANYFQIGQAGVSLFFLISGYIIPKSLNAAPNIKIFWLHRVFRLYPAYWCTLLIAIALSYAGLFHFQSVLGPVGTAINFTMLQGLLGVPNVINVFWSLKFEMVFYFVMTAVFLSGLMKRPFVLFCAFSVLNLVLALAMRLVLHKFFAYGFFNLELMLLGWVLAEWHGGRLKRRTMAISVALGLVTAIVSATTAFFGRSEELSAGTLTLLPMASAWVLSIVAFTLVLETTQRWHWPRALAWMGTVSYSAYLVHPMVLEASSHWMERGGPLFASQFILSFAFAGLGYRYIEKPLIASGKKFADRLPASPKPAATN